MSLELRDSRSGLVLLLLWATSMPAFATWLGTFDYEMDLYGSDGTKILYNTSEVFVARKYAPFSEPLEFGAGDSFSIRLDFAGNQALKYTDIDGDDDEGFGVRISNDPTSDKTIKYHQTFEFLGVEGDLPQPVIVSGANGGVNANTGRLNLTDSWFSFQGLNSLIVVESIKDASGQVDSDGTLGFKDILYGLTHFDEFQLGGTETQLFEIVETTPAVVATNTRFSNGTDGWNTSGNGTSDVIADTATGEQSVQLTVSNEDSTQPVYFSQFVNTPGTAFQITFDLVFQTSTGRLEVSLGNVLLDTFRPGDGIDFASILVNQEELLGATGLDFEFALYPGSAAQVTLDNVFFVAQEGSAPRVSAPETMALISLGLAVLGWSRRRLKAQDSFGRRVDELDE